MHINLSSRGWVFFYCQKTNLSSSRGQVFDKIQTCDNLQCMNFNTKMGKYKNAFLQWKDLFFLRFWTKITFIGIHLIFRKSVSAKIQTLHFGCNVMMHTCWLFLSFLHSITNNQWNIYNHIDIKQTGTPTSITTRATVPHCTQSQNPCPCSTITLLWEFSVM